MSVPYDVFTDAFLSKITEYDFVNMRDFERNGLIDGYMKRAIASFRKICKYDLSTTGDDIIRIGNAYAAARKDFTNMMREYSYNHGDLTDLHL